MIDDDEYYPCDDCEFQRDFLNAVKEQRRKLKEDNKCQQ